MGDLADIKNFVQLTPLVGTAGQPGREQFADADTRSPLMAKWQLRMDDVWKEVRSLEREEILPPPRR
jgi:hypothetical protein